MQYFKKSGLKRQLSATLKQDVPTRFSTICIMLESTDKCRRSLYDEVTVLLTCKEDRKLE